MRVLFITPQPVEGPSSRFRIYQFLPYLQAHGVRATVRPFLSSRLTPAIYRPGGLARKVAFTLWASAWRLLDVLRSTRYDVVWILREAYPFGPPWLERALLAGSGRMVFDFDDAIYLPSIAYRNPLDRLRDFDKPAQLIGMASRVVAGSDHLRNYALQFVRGAPRVTVIPTVVDTDEYRPASPRPPAGRCVIGWIGTPRGSSYLRSLVDVMAELVRSAPQVCFKFVGADPFDAGSLPIEFKAWRLEDEVKDLQSFDIGIMPLTDDEETRGKCGFKLIQYMSVGIPVVCSPVGANLTIVESCGNGFFASTPTEWFTGLDRLAKDAQLRRALGCRGRLLAQARYSLASAAPRMLEVLREAVL